jgi:hypothetical protein
MSKRTVVEACEKVWEATKADCNRFVKAVAREIEVPIPKELDANGIVLYVKAAPRFSKAKDALEAAKWAAEGKFVIGGLHGLTARREITGTWR